MTRRYLKWVDAPIWVKIGRNIRECRVWKNATQEDVSVKSEISLKRLKRMEKGLVLDITHLETLKIAHALNIDDDLIFAH